MKWFDLGALFTPSEKTKLAAIEDSATTDQTNTEIRNAVEAATNSNTFTDADHTKLNGIYTGADVTGSNPPQAHGASVHTDRTRHLWLGAAHFYTGTADTYGTGLEHTADEYTVYSFAIPNNFVSIGNIYVYYHATVGSNAVVLDVSAAYGAIGEAKDVHNDSDNTNIISITSTNRERFTTAGLLASAAIGDIGYIRVKRDADHGSDTNASYLTIHGVMIEYTADM